MAWNDNRSMSRRDGSWTIGKAKENRNGKLFYKGVVSVGSQTFSVTVYPSESGDNAKITLFPWTRTRR